MKKIAKKEKRLYPRIQERFPLKIKVNGYDFSTSTKNVSCIGAYCNINKYMPPFMKVMVKLTMPIVAGGRKKNYNIACSGVVVRTEDEARGGFNIAIFFNEIKNQQQKIISQYINQFLSGQSPLA